MFSGHFAVGFAGKRAAPAVSLGTLIMAAQFLDLLWPILLLVGLEHVRIAPGDTRFTPLDFYDYPITHSLVTAIGWGLLFGGGYWLARRRTTSPSVPLVLGALVVSHWLLDFVTHRPDLPLWPGGPRVGLGLWSSIAGTLAVEYALYVAGIAIYLGATRARDRVGRYALWALVIFLPLVHMAATFGPPPPSEKALAWSGLIGWLLVAWGYFIDRHRQARTAGS
jgi:hypothetical protein